MSTSGSRGHGHPGVVRVRSVYKGDMGVERFPVVVEGFGSPKFCWKPSRKVQKRQSDFLFHPTFTLRSPYMGLGYMVFRQYGPFLDGPK